MGVERQMAAVRTTRRTHLHQWGKYVRVRIPAVRRFRIIAARCHVRRRFACRTALGVPQRCGAKLYDKDDGKDVFIMGRQRKGRYGHKGTCPSCCRACSVRTFAERVGTGRSRPCPATCCSDAWANRTLTIKGGNIKRKMRQQAWMKRIR